MCVFQSKHMSRFDGSRQYKIYLYSFQREYIFLIPFLSPSLSQPTKPIKQDSSVFLWFIYLLEERWLLGILTLSPLTPLTCLSIRFVQVIQTCQKRITILLMKDKKCIPIKACCYCRYMTFIHTKSINFAD